MKRQAYFSGKTAIVTFPQSFDRVRKFKTSLQLNRKSRGRARSGLDKVWVQATQGVSQVGSQGFTSSSQEREKACLGLLYVPRFLSIPNPRTFFFKITWIMDGESRCKLIMMAPMNS